MFPRAATMALMRRVLFNTRAAPRGRPRTAEHAPGRVLVHVTPEGLKAHLKELREADDARQLVAMRQRVGAVFGDAVAAEVGSAELARDLLHLHDAYVVAARRGVLAQDDVARLRKYVCVMYGGADGQKVPAAVHAAILGMLHECGAL